MLILSWLIGLSTLCYYAFSRIPSLYVTTYRTNKLKEAVETLYRAACFVPRFARRSWYIGAELTSFLLSSS